MSFQSYNEHIKQLTKSISSMGELVRQMIELSLESLTTKDDVHKEKVHELDKQVNELEKSILEQANSMLALRAPIGDDLRFVTSAIGVSNDLERAGDLAKNISKRSLKMGEYNPVQVLEHISAMTQIVILMIRDAILAIERRHHALAIDVWFRDKSVDDHYHEILKALQDDLQKNPSYVEPITHLIFASKNFERIADYATSIARTVYYVSTGKQAGKELIKMREAQIAAAIAAHNAANAANAATGS